MEVHLHRSDAVKLPFDICQQFESAQRERFDPGGQRGIADHRQDVARGTHDGRFLDVNVGLGRGDTMPS